MSTRSSRDGHTGWLSMSAMGCPRCGSGDARRSRRRGLERLLSLFGIWPYRCSACGERFHRLGTPSDASHAASTGLSPDALIRSKATATYLGSSSMAAHTRPDDSHAAIVEPEPLNGS